MDIRKGKGRVSKGQVSWVKTTHFAAHSNSAYLHGIFGEIFPVARENFPLARESIVFVGVEQGGSGRGQKSAYSVSANPD